jgi:hypothetical protein
MRRSISVPTVHGFFKWGHAESKMQIAAFLGLVVLIVVVVLALGTAPKKGVEYSAPALAPISPLKH